MEIETSRNFDSQTCDEIRAKQTDIDKQLQSEKNRYSSMKNTLEGLQLENANLQEEILNMQTRSMRDNLLFYNFAEKNTIEERKTENCSDVVFDHLVTDLEIADAKERIIINRAHRIGRYIDGKTRPVVANFSHTPDKYAVKQAIFNKGKEWPIKISDQYPKTIQERRKALIPELIKAKDAKKEAKLLYDKLYINGKLFKPSVTPDESSE